MENNQDTKPLSYTPRPVSVCGNSIFVRSMGQPTLFFHLSWESEIIGTYWITHGQPRLPAADRANIETAEIDGMKGMDWGQDDARLDWLIELAQESGVRMDSLEQITRPLFKQGDPVSVAARLSKRGLAA